MYHPHLQDQRVSQARNLWIACCLLPQDLLFNPEDGGNTLLWNAGVLLQNYMALQLRKLYSSYSKRSTASHCINSDYEQDVCYSLWWTLFLCSSHSICKSFILSLHNGSTVVTFPARLKVTVEHYQLFDNTQKPMIYKLMIIIRTNDQKLL
jgi:hypothetical protein